MLTLGALGFAAPWFLLGLLALPLVWLLLRLTPPEPRRTRFPAIRLLFGLRQDDDSSERTPPWMLLLRLAIAALLVLAAAQPILAPGNLLTGGGPLLLAIDDGWASAPRWTAMRAAALAVLEEAEREGRAVRLLTTAPDAERRTPALREPADASETAAIVVALEPKPWPADRAGAAAALAGLERAGGAAVWVADGLDGPEASAFAGALQRLGRVQLLRPEPEGRAMLLRPPERGPEGVLLRVERAGTAPRFVTVEALDEEMQRLAEVELAFAEGETQASGTLARPGPLLDRIARFRLRGEASAGAVALVGSDWRRRRVGLAEAGGAGHPLLDDLHYLRAAMAPVADVVEGPVAELLEADIGVLALTDAAEPDGAERRALAEWLRGGGVLLRFSGPRLAEAGGEFLPAALRRGGRELGGALTWARPQRLGGFSATGPFAGLDSAGDVEVRRQVLAEPGPELAERSWAVLADGTPIVTGAALGAGWTVLVHTSANADWSNLALSGLYPQMLARLVALGRGAGGLAGAREPLRMLDGFARWTEPGAAVRPLPADWSGGEPPGPTAPPGLYGREGGYRAVNLGAALPSPAALAGLPAGVAERGLAPERERPLLPWLLFACLLLLLADALASLAYRGYLLRGARAALLLSVALAGLAGAPGETLAEDGAGIAAEVHLAYVVTGDPELDEISRAGLAGLSRTLRERTTIEPGPPQAVEVERDELAFYPLLYWPIAPGQPPLSDGGRARLAAYVAHGGMLVLDTRDHGAAAGRFDMYGALVTPERDRLRRLLAGMRVPPLAAAPPDHVLTRAFYLLQDFPGRYAGGAVWVERRASARNDNVTGYVIGSNDWAAAWAEDELGRPRFAVTPGGERQREFARRFGVNLVMHALTGNYKADQVHISAILKRLDG